VVAQEILVANDGVRALTRAGKSPQIANMMQTGSRAGMQMLEDALNELVAQGVIGYDLAVSKANAPSRIRDPYADIRRTLGSED
jgi:twitching motility protein PilT